MDSYYSWKKINSLNNLNFQFLVYHHISANNTQKYKSIH